MRNYRLVRHFLDARVGSHTFSSPSKLGYLNADPTYAVVSSLLGNSIPCHYGNFVGVMRGNIIESGESSTRISIQGPVGVTVGNFLGSPDREIGTILISSEIFKLFWLSVPFYRTSRSIPILILIRMLAIEKKNCLSTKISRPVTNLIFWQALIQWIPLR